MPIPFLNRDGACPFSWLTLSSTCGHRCWHPEGHPGCHNCEYCGMSTSRQSWETARIPETADEIAGRRGLYARQNPAPAIEEPARRRGRIPRPKPAPIVAPPAPAIARQERRPKIDRGPCLYMFFSIQADDFGPHNHECRKKTGHHEPHVCCRCGLKVAQEYGFKEEKPITYKAAYDHRRYLRQAGRLPDDRMLAPFYIDPKILRQVNFDLYPPAESRPLKIVDSNTGHLAAHYKRFAARRRRQAALATLLYNLDILILE